MKNLLKTVPLCLVMYASGGCDNGVKPNASARLDKPLEIQGYNLGMSEKMVLDRGEASCNSPSATLDADRICSASTTVSGQPGLLFFYFFDNKLEKLALTVLPKHGHLSEINKVFSEELEMKYGKPATDNALAVTWLQKEGAITVTHNDERTVTINLTSSKYESEKARRAKIIGGGVEI